MNHLLYQFKKRRRPLVFVCLLMAGFGSNCMTQTPKLTNAFAASSGIAVDSKGNAFVTGQNNKVIKITAAGKAELFAGGGRNRKDGLAKEIRFSSLAGIAIDSSDNLYVADGTRIRKITPEGFVTTIAGSEISGYKAQLRLLSILKISP